MNIGGELMRRYAPRPPSPSGAGGRPGIGAWIAAALVPPGEVTMFRSTAGWVPVERAKAALPSSVSTTRSCAW